MKNNKEKHGVNNKESSFNMADFDYFYNNENENDIMKEYVLKKIMSISIFLSVGLLIFILIYFLL